MLIIRDTWIAALVATCFQAASPAADNVVPAGAGAESGFWAPVVPPRARYRIECTVEPGQGRLRGVEEVRFTNNTGRRMSRLVLDWAMRAIGTLEIEADGKEVAILSADEQPGNSSLIPFALPEPVKPGKEVTLRCRFGVSQPAQEVPDEITAVGWHPRLWWGFETCDDYDVKIEPPAGYVLGTSGCLVEGTGYYHVDGARSFGLFIARGMQASEAKAGGVIVRCLFKPKGETCARLLLTTAVDVINFYRERFGLYPYQSLTIVPGSDRPMGGCPVATGMVAVHGQERMGERPESHWRWITAHEIGHQYWGEYVLEKDSPGWLWIGLGVYADREYARSRGIGDEHHRAMMDRYLDGVRRGLDTTVARPAEQVANVGFDFNNVVIHGKGYSIISALACVLGQEAFDRIYRRCLDEFAGRRLGVDEFQAVCEAESGQSLGWFFDQWVRSNRHLSYRVAARESTKPADRCLTEVRVERLGTLEMPVPVLARFEDGTSQLLFTDRLLKTNLLHFESDAALKDVQLDPRHELAMAIPQAATTSQAAEAKDIASMVGDLPWTGAGARALDVFRAAKGSELPGDAPWGKLGLALYDGKYYPEALEAFRRAAKAAGERSLWGFTARVWQGHVLDLLGRREEAITCYRDALKSDTGDTMRHDQYRMKINRSWVEQRLKEPFRREP